MLTALALAGSAHVTAAGIIAALLSLLAVGLVVPAPNFQRKNSGHLRFTFGYDPVTGALPPGGRVPLVGQATPVRLCVLGDDAVLTYDADAQAFGETPGYAAVTGQVNSMFSGANLAAAVAKPTGYKVVPDPNTGLPTIGVAGLETLYSPAGARIPAGTKVRAWFQATFLSSAASTISAEEPVVGVQLQIVQNRIVKDTGVGPDTVGPIWLSCIRVAIQNMGAAQCSVAGNLYVDLEQSHLDIPAANAQTGGWQTVQPG
jgi:hypothetical protein